MEETIHLLMKEYLHANSCVDSKPHRIGLRYTCSTPYALTINIIPENIDVGNEKENNSFLGQKSTITSDLHSLITSEYLRHQGNR